MLLLEDVRARFFCSAADGDELSDEVPCRPAERGDDDDAARGLRVDDANVDRIRLVRVEARPRFVPAAVAVDDEAAVDVLVRVDAVRVVTALRRLDDDIDDDLPPPLGERPRERLVGCLVDVLFAKRGLFSFGRCMVAP